MQKMKNLAYIVVMLLVLTSCGEYQKVLNKGTVEDQYKMAVKMYEAQKYGKALRLFEKIVPSYRGKPQMERIQFMIAQSNFNEKNYSLAGYYFNRFTGNYPKSSKQEEAAFFVESFKQLSQVENLKPYDDLESQKLYWNEKLSQEFDLKVLLHGTPDVELVKTILALTDDLEIKKTTVKSLQNTQKRIASKEEEMEKMIELSKEEETSRR